MQRTHTTDPGPREAAAGPTTLEFMLRLRRLVEAGLRAALARSLSRKLAGVDELDARSFAHDVMETLSWAFEAGRAGLGLPGTNSKAP